MIVSSALDSSALVDASRLKKREYNHRARLRRLATMDNMRATLENLERAALVAHTMDGLDGVWEDFLDTNSLLVRRTLRLAKEARALQLEHEELTRLLKEHQLATRVLAQLVYTENLEDDWEADLARWRELTRQHYKPWTIEACEAEKEATLKAVSAFHWSLDKQTSGLSFLGWRESRRYDPERGVFEFQFYKTYVGLDIMDNVNAGWDTYTHARTFGDVVLGHRARGYHEVLQQLGPNLVMFRTVQHFKAANVYAHIVDILFRIQIDGGFLQCLRSVVCPELMNVIDGPKDMWASNFLWQRWEELPDGQRGYRLRIGGALVGTDPTYLDQWMIEIFGCVLRHERLATNRKLIASA